MRSSVQVQCERLRLSSVRPWPLDLLQIGYVRDHLAYFCDNFSEMCDEDGDGAYVNFLAFDNHLSTLLHEISLHHIHMQCKHRSLRECSDSVSQF